MKNAIILHGTGSSPDSYWMGGIADYLKKNGYEVWAPQLPDSNKPDLKNRIPFVVKNGKFDENTLLIGHSDGCPLILSVLEKIKVRVGKAILVAAFGRKLGRLDKSLIQVQQQRRYDWGKIRAHVKDVIFINSIEDPWTVDMWEGLYLLKKLGGTLIIREGEGHMGSDMAKQPYNKFPLLEKLIDLKYSRESIK